MTLQTLFMSFALSSFLSVLTMNFTRFGCVFSHSVPIRQTTYHSLFYLMWLCALLFYHINNEWFGGAYAIERADIQKLINIYMCFWYTDKRLLLYTNQDQMCHTHSQMLGKFHTKRPDRINLFNGIFAVRKPQHCGFYVSEFGKVCSQMCAPTVAYHSYVCVFGDKNDGMLMKWEAMRLFASIFHISKFHKISHECICLLLRFCTCTYIKRQWKIVIAGRVLF